MDMKTAVIYRLEELIRQKDITVNEAAIRSGVIYNMGLYRRTF